MTRNRFTGFPLAMAALFAFSPALRAQPAPGAQNGKAKPSATSQKKPLPGPRDLTGVWDSSPSRRGGNSQYLYTFTKDEPSMTPWAAARYKTAKPAFGPRAVPASLTNDPTYKCFPPGTPRIFFHPFPMEIFQVPGRVIMFFEYDHIVRQIWLADKHPDNMIPTYMGNSIAHWEGNTLVVDTIGFNGKTWVDRIGHPSSDQLHVVERIRRVNANTLEDQITMTDPKAYTKPWGGRFLFRLRPDWHIREFVCEDNANFLKFEKQEVTPKAK